MDEVRGLLVVWGVSLLLTGFFWVLLHQAKLLRLVVVMMIFALTLGAASRGVAAPGAGPESKPKQARPSGQGVDAKVARAAFDVGFRGDGLVMAVAIRRAEGGGPGVELRNGPTQGCPFGSVDRGWWQINSCYHHEVSWRCASNLKCAARETDRISDRGRSWSPWTTYKNGSYERHLRVALDAVRAR